MLSVVLLDITPVGHDFEIPRTILLTWEAHGCWSIPADNCCITRMRCLHIWYPLSFPERCPWGRSDTIFLGLTFSFRCSICGWI